ncbi:MAG TPA: MMPL family transporter [Myxococcales bacterium]|nr:MMPL family transporter [Myxococcales bacterium]
MTPPPARSPGILSRYPEWVSKHRCAILMSAAALATIAIAAATTLPIRTDFSQLLPAREPSVVSLRRLTARKATTAVVEIGIAATDPAAAHDFAAALVPELRRLPSDLVREVDDDDLPMRRFVWEHRDLYASEAELRQALEWLRAVAAAQNPLFVDLDEAGEPALDQLEKRAQRLLEATIDRPPGYVGEGGRLRMIVVRAPFSDTEPAKGEALLAVLRGTAAALLPWHPEVEVGYAGDPVTAALEHALVLRDVAASALACFLLVSALLLAAFRSPRIVLALCASLAAGCALTFGWTRLAVGQLNSATAFLGSVVAGNGINFGIILVARYREELRRRPHAQALAEALARTVAPTLVAAAAAAAAYLSLVVTEFRGFSEFGAIAGVGMIFCWAATFLVLPALLDVLAPREPPIGRESPAGRAGWIPSRPTSIALLLCAAGFAVAGARIVLREPYEDDLGALRSPSLPSSEAGRWSRRLDAAFGRTQSGGFVLGVEHAADAPLVLSALQRAERDVERPARVLGRVDALPRALPGSSEEQQRKLDLLCELRALLRRALPRLPAEARRRVGTLLPDRAPRELGLADLPAAVRDAFVENDGRAGLLLVVHPGPAFEGWSYRGIRRAVELVRGLRFERPLQGRLEISGPEVLFVDMMRAVERDAPRATAVSAILVLLLLAAALGPGRDFAAAAFALAAGAGGMLGAMALLHVRLNFLSAVAIPITLGIGVDYPLNVIARVRQELASGGNVRAALLRTGTAVALCSATTVIGYLVLLGSDTGAIRSFGLAAVLGEVACIAAALLVAPAALVVLRRLRC